MKTTVKFDDILEALEFSGDEIQHYLNVKTGEVLTITPDASYEADSDTPLIGAIRG